MHIGNPSTGGKPATWQRRNLHPGRNDEPQHVLIAGATGFIGRKLTERLIAGGNRVTVWARNASKAVDLFGPHATVVTDLNSLPSTTVIDAVINLAGEPIAGAPWTARRREQLVASRVATTRILLELVARLTVKPTTWINASAIGYYGARDGDEPLPETAAAGSGFQAEICQRWEEAAMAAAEYGVKVALLRIGVVLGRDGGALPALARPIRWFVGTVLGSGQQWVSWIHVDDLLELIVWVLGEGNLAGPLNATAPNPVRHTELMQTIATTLQRRLWPVRVPAVLLRTALGELAELFVGGQRVLPERATTLGFRWRYPTIDVALADVLGPPPAERLSGAQ